VKKKLAVLGKISKRGFWRECPLPSQHSRDYLYCNIYCIILIGIIKNNKKYFTV
jgi:hypothetical protein